MRVCLCRGGAEAAQRWCRGGAEVVQRRRRVGEALVVVSTPLDDAPSTPHLLEEGLASDAAAARGGRRARDVTVEAAEGGVHGGEVLEREGVLLTELLDVTW